MKAAKSRLAKQARSLNAATGATKITLATSASDARWVLLADIDGETGGDRLAYRVGYASSYRMGTRFGPPTNSVEMYSGVPANSIERSRGTSSAYSARASRRARCVPRQ